MDIGEPLKQALASFAAVERDIVLIGQDTTNETALDFVRMRKKLVMEFATLGEALEKDTWLNANPDQKSLGLRLFAAFRTQNSINQASWPVVMVRDNVADYRVHSQPVAEKSRAFWQWAQQSLGFRR